MSIVEIVLYVTAALFVAAYCIKLVVTSAQIIYELAPIIVPAVIVALLFIQMNGGIDAVKKEIKAQDANYIESVEDQSNGGRY